MTFICAQNFLQCNDTTRVISISVVRSAAGRRRRINVLNTSEGAHGGVHGVPLCAAVVLATLQQVLAAAVVGMLIKDPGSVHHVTRADLRATEAIIHRGTVFVELCHVTLEVGILINPDAIHVRGLQEMGKRRGMTSVSKLLLGYAIYCKLD